MDDKDLDLERERVIHKADATADLMNNPLLVEALDNLERGYLEQLRAVPIAHPDADEVVKRMRYRLEAMDNFRNELQHFVDNGTIVKQDIERAQMSALLDGLPGEGEELEN